MARAIPFPMRFYSEVSQLVVAEWVRMVETGAPMNVDALTVAFNQILDMPTVAVKDGVGTKTEGGTQRVSARQPRRRGRAGEGVAVRLRTLAGRRDRVAMTAFRSRRPHLPPCTA